VNYGFGYVGTGFAGGVWAGNSFSYNRAVTNINEAANLAQTQNHPPVANQNAHQNPAGRPKAKQKQKPKPHPKKPPEKDEGGR
jgi:nicotinamidase-related amidase